MFVDFHTHNTNTESNVISVKNIFIQDVATFDDFFTIGLHPWHIDSFKGDIESLLASGIRQNNLLGIGEIGLDPNSSAAKETQIDLFKKQVAIAEKNNLPVIIHIVKMYDELIALKEGMNPSTPWIIHGFNKSESLAIQLQDKGFYLSFGAALMRGNTKVEEAFVACKMDKVFLETDESKIEIKDIYKKASQLKGIDVESLKSELLENFKRVFSTKYVR